MTAPATTFADASAEWLRYVEHDRDVKSSTLSDYRYMARRLNQELGETRLELLTPERIERWRAGLSCSNRTVQKYLIVLNGVFKRAMKVYGLPANPMALVERPRVRQRTDIDVLSAPEVRALIRATPSEMQRAILLTAAFAGLRMGELLALRWGEVDFAAQTMRVVRSFTIGGESSPKSGRARSVPMVDEVAVALARLGQREQFTGEEDLVFAGVSGGHLDSKDVRAAFKTALEDAGLRELRVHDLRHTFGTLAVVRPIRFSSSRSGWDRPTCRRRCATCTTSRRPAPRSGLHARSATRRSRSSCSPPRTSMPSRRDAVPFAEGASASEDP